MVIKENDLRLSGTEITTNIYTNIRISSNDTLYEPNKPGQVASREPDMLSEEDFKQANIENILGDGKTAENLAQEFASEYENMVKSIEKNKGFYIGRYELTGNLDQPTEKAGQPINANSDNNWYELYKACKKITSTEYAQSTMVYGCQWDEICQWLIDSGSMTEQQVNEDSKGFGNYLSEGGKLINTGSNNNWKINQIYDMAGNYCEWTQEAFSGTNRVARGELMQ